MKYSEYTSWNCFWATGLSLQLHPYSYTISNFQVLSKIFQSSVLRWLVRCVHVRLECYIPSAKTGGVLEVFFSVSQALGFYFGCNRFAYSLKVKCGYSARDLMECSPTHVGYAFDDLICMPGHIDFGVHDVDLLSHFTRSISLKTPIASSPMDTVTEASMAIAMALEGGIGIIHSKMPIERQAEQVQSVKRYEQGFISNPMCIAPNMTCGELLKLREKCGFSGFPVTENGQLGSKLLGLVTKRDSDFFSSESILIKDSWPTVKLAKLIVLLSESARVLSCCRPGSWNLIALRKSWRRWTNWSLPKKVLS